MPKDHPGTVLSSGKIGHNLRNCYWQVLEDRLEVLETGANVWQRFSEMKARQKKIGQKVGDLDLLIAATASEHGLTVATLRHRNSARIEGLVWDYWET